MFLQDLLEAHEVEALIVLQQYEAEVELGEGQLEVLRLANGGAPAQGEGSRLVGAGHGLSVLPGGQLALKTGVLPLSLGQLLCGSDRVRTGHSRSPAL